jgi:TusA-related sulfurtransferase
MTDYAPTQVLAAPGMACITLTPLIKRTIVELPPGTVLEVQTDDPAAREGIPAWCRLTKNPLLDIVEHSATETSFHIEAKKPNTDNQEQDR